VCCGFARPITTSLNCAPNKTMLEPTNQITTANGPHVRAEGSPKRPGSLSSHTSDPTLARNHSTVRDQACHNSLHTLSRLTPAHGLEQSATSRSLGQTRWRSICARFMVWNPLHQVEEVHIMEQEIHQGTAQALFPTQQILCSFQDLCLGSDSSPTNPMSSPNRPKWTTRRHSEPLGRTAPATTPGKRTYTVRGRRSSPSLSPS